MISFSAGKYVSNDILRRMHSIKDAPHTCIFPGKLTMSAAFYRISSGCILFACRYFEYVEFSADREFTGGT